MKDKQYEFNFDEECERSLDEYDFDDDMATEDDFDDECEEDDFENEDNV